MWGWENEAARESENWSLLNFAKISRFFFYMINNFFYDMCDTLEAISIERKFTVGVFDPMV